MRYANMRKRVGEVAEVTRKRCGEGGEGADVARKTGQNIRRKMRVNDMGVVYSSGDHGFGDRPHPGRFARNLAAFLPSATKKSVYRSYVAA